ncbi:hypothetical protein BB560_005509 [Smittium megazygosporum]|uniref:AAA+ ATPase domain-containing protein n=1 Tax=Smittium megazygosporum TaxID=133381 RepID=A0A2T9Z4B7_9FUNG|nr:hypothetical protein BB560_005509 [Smittium megazygosporum]
MIKFDSPPSLEKHFQKLLEILYYPTHFKPQLAHLGLDLPKGLLLYGPPGVGKTMLICETAKICNLPIVSINSSDIISSYIGDSEQNLRDSFNKAVSLALENDSFSILFIDEIDALAPKRDDLLQFESRLVSQLLTLLDGIIGRENVVVIAATNRPNSIDPALRRPGRLEREIFIEVPNFLDRKKIINYYLSNSNFTLNSFHDKNDIKNLETQSFNIPEPYNPSQSTHSIISDSLIGMRRDELCHSTHGFVGADIAALFREAGLHAISRKFNNTKSAFGPDSGSDSDNLNKKSPDSIQNPLPLSREDFLFALTRVVPSIKRSYSLDIGKLSWSDLGGMEDELTKALEWPLKYGDKMRLLGAAPPQGILLYGPPGCSKTCIAKIIAHSYSSTCSFFTINSAEIFSPFVGDSEYVVRNLYLKARQSSPSVVFFDEIDVIVGKRDFSAGKNPNASDEVQSRVLSTLLNEMDGIEKFGNILTVGATNRPDLIDPALMRPGRFDKLIYVPPPNLSSRKEIFKIKLKDSPTNLSAADFEYLAQKTNNFSGADIGNLCQEAALFALRSRKNDSPIIEIEHFKEAMKTVQPSLSNSQINFYEKLRQDIRISVRPYHLENRDQGLPAIEIP